ncbi:MAG: segregation/condensation protein A, partial [Candidatus Marinimicrobia bacterium]|nr:segregation/condensation protein A [Candidatus Neomarinimicrobiota bacterium]
QAGFKGVEYLFPYGDDKHRLADLLAAHGLTQALHNLPAGDWDGGDRGLGCLADRVGEFQDGVGLAVEYATALGCKRLNALAGVAPEGADPDELRETFVANLRFAAAECATAGITLVTEPIKLDDQISVIRRSLDAEGRVSFKEILLKAADRHEVVVTFLALLEMVKRHQIMMLQAEPFGDILLQGIEVQA